MRKTPAYQSAGDTKQLKLDGPLQLVSADLLKSRTEDVFGNSWFMATKDNWSGYPKGLPLAHKQPELAWEIFQEMHPGSRFDHNSSFLSRLV